MTRPRYPAWSAARRVQAREPSAQLYARMFEPDNAAPCEVRVGSRVLARGRTIPAAWNAALAALEGEP